MRPCGSCGRFFARAACRGCGYRWRLCQCASTVRAAHVVARRGACVRCEGGAR